MSSIMKTEKYFSSSHQQQHTSMILVQSGCKQAVPEELRELEPLYP